MTSHLLTVLWYPKLLIYQGLKTQQKTVKLSALYNKPCDNPHFQPVNQTIASLTVDQYALIVAFP